MSGDSLSVAVAARDGDYLRFAAAVLTRAGHVVQTTTFRFARVERLLAAEHPHVLLLEGGDPGVTRLRSRATLMVPPVTVVVVGENADVAKWAPAADLVAAVESASRVRRPRLRLVEG